MYILHYIQFLLSNVSIYFLNLKYLKYLKCVPGTFYIPSSISQIKIYLILYIVTAILHVPQRSSLICALNYVVIYIPENYNPIIVTVF